MRARYYDPALGRFVSKDPAGIEGGDFNLYAYVHNNPTAFTDPSGMFFDILFDIAFIAYDIYSLVTEPSWTNAAALGLDLIGAVVPVATPPGVAASARGRAARLVVAGGAVVGAVAHLGGRDADAARAAHLLGRAGRRAAVALVLAGGAVAVAIALLGRL
jgi:uncharacterized protein RhaS with RHS repeats